MDRIQHPTAVVSEPAYTPTGTKGFATPGNPGAGQLPTIFPAAYWNMLQEEVINAIEASGQTPAFGTRTQLRDAIRTLGKGSSFGTTTNTGDDYSLTLTPTLTELTAGLAFAIIFNATNTGAATLDIDGLGAADIVKSNGDPLDAGNIVADTLYPVVFDGTDFRLNVIDAVTTGGINNFTGSNYYTGPFGFPDSGELTIASGAITVTGVAHTVDTEADAVSDDLDTINGGADGRIVILTTEAGGRDVTLTTAGNISIPNATSVTLADTNESVALIYSGALSKWLVVSSVIPNASETVKGVVEKATDAQFLAGTAVGETGAPLFADPNQILNGEILASGTFSAVSNIDMEPVFDDATFKRGYLFDIGFTVSDNGVFPDLLMKYAGAYLVANYSFQANGGNSSSNQSSFSASSTSIRPVGTGVGQGMSNSANSFNVFRFYLPPVAQSTVFRKRIQGSFQFDLTGTDSLAYYVFSGGQDVAVTALQGIRLAMSAGTISGYYQVKGIR